MSKSVEKRVSAQLGQTRNSVVLASFIAYCQQNPNQRFWQALRNWSTHSFILVSDAAPYELHITLRDTFNWENRDH